METRQALLVDAFADEPMAGNPAGVVPDASDLADDQLRAIASELGATETAFVLPSDDADRRLRYFSPETELDHSGHAAVAAHAALFERGVIDDGTHTVETDAGILDVELIEDGTVWLEQDDASVRQVDVSHEEAAEALGIDVATLRDVGADVPISRASTGVPTLLVPINYFEHLSNVDPDGAAVAELCERADCESLSAFTFDTLDGEATVHVRRFDPSTGGREEPATGTAAGALSAYLRRHDAMDGEFDEILVEQGHFLDRPGTVRVETDGDEVRVGGRGVTTFDGSLVVPTEEEDEIIEV